jgi:hypothetical protein
LIVVLGSVVLSGCVVGYGPPISTPGAEGPPTVRALPRRAARPAPPATAVALQQIIGLDQPEVEARLGSPVIENVDGLTKVLEFRERRCSMELRLYPDVNSRAFRTLSFEVTSDANTPQGVRTCIRRFASRIGTN